MNWCADVNHDGSVDGEDIIAFYTLWDIGAFDADSNQNGAVDGDDIIAFFAYWDNGDGAGRTTADNRFGFRGYVWDDHLKLYHVRHRVFDPTPGPAGMRWLQRDPAFFVDGLNLYAYCGGDPVNGRDPMGLANEPPNLDTILRELERIERVLEEIDELPDEQRTQLTNRRKDLESQLPTLSPQGSNPIEEAMGPVDRSTCDGPMTTPRTGPEQRGKAATDEIRGGTYLLRDTDTGQVMRTGRTNDLLRRRAEHSRDSALNRYEFEPVHRTDSYAEQRGLEQMLHDQYRPPLNKINPISLANRRRQEFLDAAQQYITRGGD